MTTQLAMQSVKNVRHETREVTCCGPFVTVTYFTPLHTPHCSSSLGCCRPEQSYILGRMRL